MRRYVEIGLTIVCIAVCAMTGSLWVRSQRSASIVNLCAGHTRLEIISIEGRLKLTTLSPSARPAFHVKARDYPAQSSEASTIYGHMRRFANPNGFGLWQEKNMAVLFPYWFPMLAFAAASALFGIRRLRRFSIRTLLFATATLALLLWMAVGGD